MEKVLSFIQKNGTPNGQSIVPVFKEIEMIIHLATKRYIQRCGIDVHCKTVEYMNNNYSVRTFSVGLVTIVIDVASWISNLGPRYFADWAYLADGGTIAGIIFGSQFTGITGSGAIFADIKVVGDSHYSIENICEVA